MQRKELIKKYGVEIYQKQGCYVLVVDGEEKLFKYMGDIEDFLSKKYGKSLTAEEWINEILSNPGWTKVGIDWTAVEEIKSKLEEVEKLKRENFGLKRQVENLKEKFENNYRNTPW